jgi:micrococcal nuclease
MDWSSVTYESSVPFKPSFSSGKVVKVYDGDTITIATQLDKQVDTGVTYRFSVRLRGIDCPEMRTKNANEKKCAKLAKTLVMDAIYEKIVTLENIDYDKYGRVLADVMTEDGRHVNDLLLKENLAVEYSGGKKSTPDDWMEYYESRAK